MLFENHIDLCPLLIRIFPTHSQILPHRLCLFERSLSDSLKMPATHRKIVPGEYYFKIRIDSARRNEALCGC